MNEQIEVQEIMEEKWKLSEQELQKLLLVRKVVIAPLIGEKLVEENVTGKNFKSARDENALEDHSSDEIF